MTEKQEGALGIGVILVLSLVGVALIIAAVNLGAGLVPPLVGLIFQVLISAAGVVLVGWLCLLSVQSAIKRIESLERRYDKELKILRRRVPTFGAAIVVVAEAVKTLADKAFKEQKVPTLAVTLCLVLAFWVANELVNSDRRPVRTLGFVVWVLGVVALPVFVMVHRAYSPSDLLHELWGIDLQTKLFFGIMSVSLIILPFLVKRLKD